MKDDCKSSSQDEVGNQAQTKAKEEVLKTPKEPIVSIDDKEKEVK